MRTNELPSFGNMNGVKLITTGTNIAGPVAATFFAEQGADVIHIESSKSPDMLRRMGRTWTQEHRNARSMALNIPSPEGKEIFFKLIEKADVLIEASKGGQYDKWGLTDQVLWQHNPSLVIAHVSGFGQTGEPSYVNRPSFDPIGQALPGFPVFLRWSPIDLVPGGNNIEDALELASYLDNAGFGYINIQIGWHESSVPTTTKEIKDGHWSWVSAELKRVVRKTPIVTGYRETDPDVMEKILAEGKADLIGGLRYSLADPEFSKKLREGREKEIRKCVCCCRCLDDMSAGKGQEYCSVNPGLGPELLKKPEKAPFPRKVMVIGSGPAGLSAALTAAKQGHNVTIFERGPRIGGCLVLSKAR